MKRMLYGLAFALLAAGLFAPATAADDPLAAVIKQDGNTVSLDLRFDKKRQSTVQHVLSFLDYGANGYATGFVVGERLVLIARPNGEKSVRRGKFSGPYSFRGKQYWAARIEAHDGFSGSPVYND